jgi:hypothetical protein
MHTYVVPMKPQETSVGTADTNSIRDLETWSHCEASKSAQVPDHNSWLCHNRAGYRNNNPLIQNRLPSSSKCKCLTKLLSEIHATSISVRLTQSHFLRTFRVPSVLETPANKCIFLHRDGYQHAAAEKPILGRGWRLWTKPYTGYWPVNFANQYLYHT